MNYYCVPNGYGWVFPKEKNRFSCGIGTWGKALDLKKKLEEFIEKSFPENSIEKIEISGYPIPIYQGKQKIATKRILLTGDAASLAAPVSGEGIRFALYSGKIAASVIMEEFIQNKSMCTSSLSQRYQKIISEKIGEKLNYNLSFVALAFYNNPKMFYQTFLKKNKA